MTEALRTGELPLGDLTSEEHSWLATALAHLNRVYKNRGAGNPGNEAFCVFEVGKVYVQFLATWDAEKLVCEAVSAKSVAKIAPILTTESEEALRGLGFGAPEISPNYSQTIEIKDVEDLAYAARLAFRVLKQVYRVADFSSALFKQRIPVADETAHVHIRTPQETMDATARRETAREAFARRASGNPQFREDKKPGIGFVMVGARPPREGSDKAAAPEQKKSGATLVLESLMANGDSVLENLLRAYPKLTREEAVEALKAAGFY